MLGLKLTSLVLLFSLAVTSFAAPVSDPPNQIENWNKDWRRDNKDYRRDNKDYRRDNKDYRRDNKDYRRDNKDYRRNNKDWRSDQTLPLDDLREAH